jgi:membrane protease YdiL (CAAX protease family)
LKHLSGDGLLLPPASGLRDALWSLLLFLLLLGWVTSFWGRAGLLLPPPFDNWHYVFFRALTRWSIGARAVLRVGDHVTFYAGLEAYLLGLLVPASMLRLFCRLSPADLGLRAPDAAGWRWTLTGVALAVPAGLAITAVVPPGDDAIAYAVRTCSMIPEHFLICGVGIGLLLPERRLAPTQHRGASLFAILGSVALFVAAHVGAPPLEVGLSAPLGLVFAFMTWRTTSIWPALLVHWSLNLAPLGLRAAFG